MPITDFINKPVIVNQTGDEINQQSQHLKTLKFIIYGVILHVCSRSTESQPTDHGATLTQM